MYVVMVDKAHENANLYLILSTTCFKSPFIRSRGRETEDDTRRSQSHQLRLFITLAERSATDFLLFEG